MNFLKKSFNKKILYYIILYYIMSSKNNTHPLESALLQYGVSAPIKKNQINQLKQVFNIQNNTNLLKKIKQNNKTIKVNSINKLTMKQFNKLYANKLGRHPIESELSQYGLRAPINKHQINQLKKVFNTQNNTNLLKKIKQNNKTIKVNSINQLTMNQYNKIFMNKIRKDLNKKGGKRVIHTGSRGGKYYMKGGNKVYI